MRGVIDLQPVGTWLVGALFEIVIPVTVSVEVLVLLTEDKVQAVAADKRGVGSNLGSLRSQGPAHDR